jgi:predicted permease
MSWRRELSRLGALYRRSKLADDLEEEIRCHLQMEKRENLESGMPPEEAHYAALRRFGNVTLAQERSREVWGWNWLEDLAQDVRYGLRMLARNPGFTAVAVLTLALGIGANTAIFSLLNTLMLRMLPVRDPGQLVEFLELYPGDPPVNGYGFKAYQFMRDHNHVLSGLISASNSYFPPPFRVRRDGFEPEKVEGEYVSGNYFPLLGVKPALGRLIGPEDDSTAATPPPVAVVSWSYWKGRFDLDPAILGKRITVEDVPLTIVGVAPRGFFGIEVGYRPEIWVPLATEAIIHRTTRRVGVRLMGRLKPGGSIEQARAEMELLYRQTFDEAALRKDPQLRTIKLDVEPAGAGLSHLRYQFGKPLLFLMAIVGLLLLIACTNVASMLLARGAAREHEMALRVSLGAGPIRLVRQVLTESLLLSAAGSLGGISVAYAGVGALVRIITSGRERVEIQVQPDAHVLLFTAGAALVTGVLFGLVPALRAMATPPASVLQAAGRASQSRLGCLFGKSLVVAQVALSVVLLSAAGLFISHLWDLRNHLGFRRDHLLLVTLDPTGSGYSPRGLSGAYQELLGRLEALPGVRLATLSGKTPISAAGASRFVTVEGYYEKPEDRRYISLNWIAPKYFETLGTPFVAGRDFTFHDGANSHLAIINQEMAHYYFGRGNPLGRHFSIDGDRNPYEIVGVVGDAKYIEAREAAPRTIYFAAFQGGEVSSHEFTLRTSVAPAAVAGEVRRTVDEVLKGVRVERITTMADQVDASIVPERLIAMLSGVFGALGLMLAAVGLYGLLAYTVARRSNEIGIRMALGATRGGVTWMVLQDALAMVLSGLAIGIPVALWGREFAARVLEGLPESSAVPIAFGIVTLIAVALVASYVPARRATKVDPMGALRHE